MVTLEGKVMKLAKCYIFMYKVTFGLFSSSHLCSSVSQKFDEPQETFTFRLFQMFVQHPQTDRNVRKLKDLIYLNDFKDLKMNHGRVVA